jgi:hypothetical protein
MVPRLQPFPLEGISVPYDAKHFTVECQYLTMTIAQLFPLALNALMLLASCLL